MKKTMKKWQGVVLVLAAFFVFGTFDKAQAASGVNGIVHASIVQSDGKIIIGGGFTSYNGTVRNGLARLNSDGSLDSNFNIGTGTAVANGKYVQAVAVQSDGKILIGGSFNSYNGIIRNAIARLNTDGTIDTGFNPSVGSYSNIRAVTIQSDGKILIGGFLQNGKDMARLNLDGTIDSTFNYTEANNNVRTIIVQSDGKILIGGDFNGTAKGDMRRLNVDGTIDSTFHFDARIDFFVSTMSIQSDRKILIGGFNTGGTLGHHIARLNSDGTIDPTFNCGTGIDNQVKALAIQTDGKIVIGGDFTTYNGISKNSFIRLNVDGTLDSGFDFFGNGKYGWVSSTAIQSDGKIIIGGSSSFNNGIARLNADGTLDASFNFDVPVVTVTGITIKTPPFREMYLNGDALDLSQMVVTITRSDGSSQDVDFSAFATNGITTDKKNGEKLGMGDTSVKVMIGGSVAYQQIVVNDQQPISSGCSRINLSAGFNNFDIPIKKNLVVITHGVGGSAHDRVNAQGRIDYSWVAKMQSEICNKIDKTNTTIVTYDWEDGANVDFLHARQAYNYAGEVGGPILASKITSLLHNNDIQLSNIHFIAHSAGSNLIQTAVKSLDTFYANHSIKRPFIHLTFLDAYAPKHENEEYGKLYNFPTGYAEQYVDTFINNLPGGDYMDTNIMLPNVVNFDVTDLPDSRRTHEWPYELYNKSIVDSRYGFGFAYALEGINNAMQNVGMNGYVCKVDSYVKNSSICKINGSDVEQVILFDTHRPVVNPPIETPVDVSRFMSSYDGGYGEGLLPQITINSNLAYISIQDHTTIHSDSYWDGILTTPKITEVPEFSKKNAHVTAIEIGYEQGTLLFDEAARIELPGMTRKDVGYIKPGKSFVKIEDVCASDDQFAGNALPIAGNCKMDLPNGNLVIWTKHFTTFVTYTPDTIAPTTTLSTLGDGGLDWFRSDVQVTLTATDNDDGSGVDKTEYSLDNGATWVAYTNPFTISNEGTNEIKFRSTDKAENVEADQNATIKIDKTAPIIKGIATPAANGKGWNNTDVKVDFVCEDIGVNQSGIDVNTVAGNTLTFEGAKQSLTNTGECMDKAGNKALPLTVSGINIDKTVPEAKVSPSIDDASIEVSGTDNLTNVVVTQESDRKYTLSDEAGNTTKIELEGDRMRKEKESDKDSNNRLKRWYSRFDSWKRFFGWFSFGKDTESKATAKIKSIQYNTLPIITLPKNSMEFKWKTSKTQLTTLKEQSLELFGKFKIEAEYNEKKNETKIEIHENGKPKKEILTGIRPIRFETNKGMLQYGY